jgi:hypothetical protein
VGQVQAVNVKTASSSRRAAAAFAAAVAACLLLCATVRAAPVPTPLDPVAPGVPGNGRAWELVTPGEVAPVRINGLEATSPGGDRVAYTASGAFTSSAFGTLDTYNIAERQAGGWVTTKPLEYPVPFYAVSFARSDEGVVRFSSDLTSSIWVNNLTPAEGPGATEERGLFASKPDGTYALLANMGGAPFFNGAGVAGVSEDVKRVVFAGGGHLLPADAARTAGTSIYEANDGALSLLDVADGGALISDCGSVPAAVRDDARRVFFRANPACGPSARVYLRAAEHTTEISTSQCTSSCGPEADVALAAATASGSQAFLTTAERLTDEDGDSESDIYRYDVATGKLTLLYQRSPGSTATVAVVRPSADGSRVYLLTEGQLQPGQGSEESNLYLIDAGGLRFVAPVARNGSISALDGSNFVVSDDGRYALFPSPAQLAGGDADESVDLYRYDAADHTSVRISAGVDGRGNGAASADLTPVRPASDIGQRVFFSTAEQLLPQDRNAVADLYEWTPGNLALVSAGTPGYSATYAGGTSDGRTVFFLTGATLLPRDRDGGEGDLYAARVGGGFAEPTEGGPCDGCEALAAGRPREARSGRAGGSAAVGVELARIRTAARRQLARDGWTTLVAEVPGAGRLSARGQSRRGARRLTVAAGSVDAREAGPIRLRLSLTPSARALLEDGQKLRVRLILRFAGSQAAHDVFSLTGRG